MVLLIEACVSPALEGRSKGKAAFCMGLGGGLFLLCCSAEKSSRQESMTARKVRWQERLEGTFRSYRKHPIFLSCSSF